jgi:hypothetical protein
MYGIGFSAYSIPLYKDSYLEGNFEKGPFSVGSAPRERCHNTAPAQPPWATPHLSHFQKVCLKDRLAKAVTDFFSAPGRLHRSESASRSRGIA